MKDGDFTIQFVGYDILIEGGKPALDSSGDLVACPMIKRFLNTKAWSTSIMTDAERMTTYNIYAREMADAYKNIEPLYHYCVALYHDNPNQHKVKASSLRVLYISRRGHVGGEKQILDFARWGNIPPVGVTTASWMKLACLSAGTPTQQEWASMCGLTTLRIHGKDLAAQLPQAWLEK